MHHMIYYIIIATLLFAIYGSFHLSKRDYRKKDICPKVLGIPACYIVFVFFVGGLVVHLLLSSEATAYYALIGIPFLLALSGTVTELSGKVICPRTKGGTPMCYLSLGFCTFLLALKFFSF